MNRKRIFWEVCICSPTSYWIFSKKEKEIDQMIWLLGSSFYQLISEAKIGFLLLPDDRNVCHQLKKSNDDMIWMSKMEQIIQSTREFFNHRRNLTEIFLMINMWLILSIIYVIVIQELYFLRSGQALKKYDTWSSVVRDDFRIKSQILQMITCHCVSIFFDTWSFSSERERSKTNLYASLFDWFRLDMESQSYDEFEIYRTHKIITSFFKKKQKHNNAELKDVFWWNLNMLLHYGNEVQRTLIEWSSYVYFVFDIGNSCVWKNAKVSIHNRRWFKEDLIILFSTFWSSSKI